MGLGDGLLWPSSSVILIESAIDFSSTLCVANSTNILTISCISTVEGLKISLSLSSISEIKISFTFGPYLNFPSLAPNDIRFTLFTSPSTQYKIASQLA